MNGGQEYKPPQVEVVSVSDVTPYDEAVFEAGKGLYGESIGVSRDFCKMMITIGLSAIPILIALFKLTSQEGSVGYEAGVAGVVFLIVIFLGTATLAFIGYLPKPEKVFFSDVIEVENFVRSSVSRRMQMGWLSLGCFIFGVLMSVLFFLTN